MPPSVVSLPLFVTASLNEGSPVLAAGTSACQGFDEYACQSFACIDPAAPCVDDDSITVDMFESCNYPKGIGNGWCDEGNNIEECGKRLFLA